MLYASFSRSMVSSAETEAGVKASKRVEASGPEDITESAIRQEMGLESKAESSSTGSTASTGFARPKRPGRR